ncbi:MAG: hypothetical protein JWP12_3853 [Bacteroidetes bacterium]|nr:hypothetical protein [Bacteroidota bacterium]
MKSNLLKSAVIFGMTVITAVLSPGKLSAQDNVGIGTNTPDASAILEILSANKGVLVPRMNTVGMNAIAAPANSLLIYNTDSMCYFFYRQPSSTWVSLCALAAGGSGAPGATGATGAAGVAGTNGIHCWDTNGNGVNDPSEDTNGDGSWNAADCAGTAGATGATGANGTNGATGTTGDVGATGIAGTTGATGLVGPTGFGAGTPGATGTTGATGATGIAGTTGVAGSTGVAGNTGATGANGTTGATGIAGTTGVTGSTGVAGNTGATGVNGTTGATGANGTTGSTGVAGATGANGTTGATGAAGATGVTGSTGIAGAAGSTGATGPTWTLSTLAYNTSGTLTLNGTAGSGGPLTTTTAAWLTTGNTGTTAGTNYIGTNDAQAFIIKTGGVAAANERIRVLAAGQTVVNNTTAAATDVFSAYGTGSTGAINGLGVRAIAGYSSTVNGIGVFGTNNGTGAAAGIGVAGTNGDDGIGVFGTAGNLGVGLYADMGTTSGDGMDAFTNFAGTTFGIWGVNSNATGAAVVGSSGGLGSVFSPSGSGVTGSGTSIGVYGNALSTSAAGTQIRTGGYFTSGSNGAATPTFSTWAYVGAMSNAGVTGNGIVARKIEGIGTVNTVVKDMNDQWVVLSCPEAPEDLFEDYGSATLVNGTIHIELDPIFAKNIVVSSEHPLRVYIQVEGDCKGVYVTNKSGNGFDVTELQAGNSNVKFSYHVVANRADQTVNGTTFVFSKERFSKAIPPQEAISKQPKERTITGIK